MTRTTSAVAASGVTSTPARVASLVAGLLGLVVVYTVGFAQPATIHNAAHDSRHSFAFPCH